MSKLKFKADLIDEKATIYIDNIKIKETNSLGSIELELSNKKHTIFIETEKSKSNILQLKETDRKEIIIKVSKFFNIGRIIRVVILLGLTSFSMHKAIGIGYYVLIIGSVLVGYIINKKKNSLILELK